MPAWNSGDIRKLNLEEIGEYYGRYRLQVEEAERAMEGSLKRYGQISPIVVCLREDKAELIDGFKRLWAARRTKGFEVLSARVLEADDRTAKAAIYGLNRVGRHINELEEAWIVQALVREDGLTQVEVAELLGRHKSWVSRRLALVEKLCGEAKEDLRLGLLSTTAARELVRLPAGNQQETLGVFRRESLSVGELRGVVDLLLSSPGQTQQEYVLDNPRQALEQANALTVPARDPRLSGEGNRLARQLGHLLERLARMETWLRFRGQAELSFADKKILAPEVSRLSRDARVVAELAEDFYSEIDVG
jgi:ParB-like chromosome segregation protein Spo0J